MGSARLRTVLFVSALAVAALATGIWALTSPGESSETARQNAPAAQAAAPSAADPTRSDRPAASETPRTASPKPPAAKTAEVKAKPEYKVLSTGSCEASYYWEAQPTASGEQFDPTELTAAHKTLPMDTKVRVTNKSNGKSVIVRINDRGPYVGGRCLDLSKAAMAEVGGTGAGVISAKYEILSRS